MSPGFDPEATMAPSPPTTESTASPVQQIPPVEAIRRRLADLTHERSILRQLLRVAVRRERDLAVRAGQEARRGR
jgi:hypothetical protein